MPKAYSADERARLILRAEQRYGIVRQPAGPPRQREYPAELGAAGEATATDSAIAELLRRQAEDIPQLDDRVVEAVWSLHRCLTIRAESIMTLPLTFYRGHGVDRERVEDGPLVDLFDRPNPFWDWPSLLAMTEWSMTTSRRGAFWLLDAFVAGRPTEIWWVDSDRVTPVLGKADDEGDDRYIKGFTIARDQGRKPLPVERERVVWFRSPGTAGEFGHSPVLAPAMAPALLALRSVVSNRLLFEQGMTGAGVVSPSDGTVWTQKQVGQIQGMLAGTLKGRSGWHRLAVMNRGDFKIDALSLTPKDAQFQELLQITDRQIAIATGVPKPLIEPTDSTLTNSVESRGMLWSNTLIPQVVRYAATIKRQVVDRYFAKEADGVEFDLSVVPELKENALDAWSLQSSRWAKIEELGRAVQAGEYDREAAIQLASWHLDLDPDTVATMLPPRGGVTATPAQVAEARTIVQSLAAGTMPRDAAIALLSVLFGSTDIASVTVGKLDGKPSLPSPDAPGAPLAAGGGDTGDDTGSGAAPPLVGPSAPSGDAGPEPDGDTPDEPVEDSEPPAELARSTAAPVWVEIAPRSVLRPARNRRDLLDEIGDGFDEFEPLAAGLFGEHAADAVAGLRRVTEAELADILDSIADDPANLTDEQRERLDARYAALVLGTGFVPRHISRAQDVLTGPLGEQAGRVGRFQYGALGLRPDAFRPGQAVADIVTFRTGVYAASTSDTSWRSVGRWISRGVLDGDSLRDIRRNVEANVEGWSGDRAELAAWSLVHNASAEVAHYAAGEGGARFKTWLTAADDRVRPAHKSLESVRLPYDEDFVDGDGAVGPQPGSMSVLASNLRCRCNVTYER